MSELYSTLLSALTASGLASILVYVAKRVLEKSLERRLAKDIETLRRHHAADIEMLKTELAVVAGTVQLWATARFAGLLKVSELAYRLRNYTRDLALSQEQRVAEQTLKQLVQLCDAYEAVLFGNRLVLHPETFTKLHNLKLQLRSFRRMLNMCRPDGSESLGQKSLVEKWAEIDKSWDDALRRLRQEEPKLGGGG